MGKYYSYGKKLDEAFKTARDEYAKYWKNLQDAKSRFEEAGRWRSGETQSERELSVAKAKISFVTAQQDFEREAPAIWATFNQTRAELRRGLEKEVHGNNLADPSAIDSGALELLRSGIMEPDDFYKMAERFDENPTMLRLLSKFAKGAAEDADDRKSRAAFNEIAMTCADGLGSVMRAWDGLSQIADYCSGQAHGGRRNSPEQVIAMGRWWEQLAGETVENF